jgi:hypothetical protein
VSFGQAVKLADYLIETDGFDWPALLQHWHWLVHGTWTVWFMNRFGDLFMHQGGPVHRLSLDNGSFQALADSKDQFADDLDQDDNASDWLLIPLVDRLLEAGHILANGQCYGFIQLPILGGDYSVENVAIRDVARQYATLGRVFEKLKDVPDGNYVSYRLTD